MGGEREIVCPSKDIGKGMTLGDIRIHESDGDVHFHDDSSKLKVAVPCGVWFSAWLKLMVYGGNFSYIDTDRGAMVQVNVVTHDAVVDVETFVEKIEVGDTFKAMQKFTFGKR
jgi:hypothetical protein